MPNGTGMDRSCAGGNEQLDKANNWAKERVKINMAKKKPYIGLRVNKRQGGEESKT